MADLQFFYCGACGTMSMHNFRDDSCPACKVIMNVQMVTIYFDQIDHVDIREAPHTEQIEGL